MESKINKVWTWLGSFASITGVSLVPICGFVYASIKSYTWVCVLLAITFVITIIVFVVKMPFYRGVFAVSAIIINREHKILLIREGKNHPWKQPGGHYKMNRMVFRKKLDTPFEFIKKIITEEVGIDSSKFTHFIYDREQKSLSESYNGLGDFGENESSPSPFYVLKENATGKLRKTSGEKYHIDFFYGFIAPDSIELTDDNKCWMSIDDISKYSGPIYKDLVPVGENLIRQHKKLSYPESQIRLCTFSAKNSNKKIYWRLTKECNARCSYCVSRCNINGETNFPEITCDKVDEVIMGINGGQYEKVVITGGEPTKCSILTYVIEQLDDKVPSCKEVSLCTNGINWSYDLFNKLCNIHILSKFVVSVDCYNNNRFIAAKGLDNNTNYLEKVEELISFLKKKGKVVTVNIVASAHFLSHPEKFVDYWREHKYDDISISYPVFTNNYIPNFRSRLLGIYNKILSGIYGDVSFCKNFELILPDCEMNGCANPHGIHSIDENGKFHNKCLELERREMELKRRESKRIFETLKKQGICLPEDYADSIYE